MIVDGVSLIRDIQQAMLEAPKLNRLQQALSIVEDEHAVLTNRRNALAGTRADMTVLNARRDRLRRIMTDLALLIEAERL